MTHTGQNKFKRLSYFSHRGNILCTFRKEISHKISFQTVFFILITTYLLFYKYPTLTSVLNILPSVVTVKSSYSIPTLCTFFLSFFFVVFLAYHH